METELTIKDKINNPIIIQHDHRVGQHDDLKFDGKTITIPSYYVNIILDYIKDYEVDGVPQVDIDDYISFRDFLYDIQDHKNQGN